MCGESETERETERDKDRDREMFILRNWLSSCGDQQVHNLQGKISELETKKRYKESQNLSLKKTCR